MPLRCNFGKPVVLKGQVHSGGRGKAGAVKLAKTPAEAKELAEGLAGVIHSSSRRLAQICASTSCWSKRASPIKQEIYLAITQDRATQRDVIILSTMGGMDIEEVAARQSRSHRHRADRSAAGPDRLRGARRALFGAGFDKTLINKAVSAILKAGSTLPMLPPMPLSPRSTRLIITDPRDV